jgi:two-component system, LytTR family, response regulator
MPIQTIIIEDEQRSLHVISDLIHQYAADLEVIDSSGYVDQGAELISHKLPQLVFMDIQLADGSGFDVLKKLHTRGFELIFITAHDTYAVNAFKASAIDYLLKPIGIPEFEEAVGRARQRIEQRRRNEQIDNLLANLVGQRGQERKIGISTAGSYEFIDLKDILWCMSDGSYTHFYLTNGLKLTSSRNLGFYEPQLCDNNFCRIHNTTIVNLRFIKSYIKGKNSYIVLLNGTSLEISQRRKSDFLERFFPE